MGVIRDAIEAGTFPDRQGMPDQEFQEAGDVLASHAYWCMGLGLSAAVAKAGVFLREQVGPALAAGGQDQTAAREFLAELRAQVLADEGRIRAADLSLLGEGEEIADLPF